MFILNGVHRLKYDDADPISIETYGKKLIGKTFNNVCEEDEVYISDADESMNYAISHENKNRKGGLGELIEERFFHYDSNNDSKPDFDMAGVELKVTPYKQNKTANERGQQPCNKLFTGYFTSQQQVNNPRYDGSHQCCSCLQEYQKDYSEKQDCVFNLSPSRGCIAERH